uniref:Retrotransposon protein, putative, Ty3-gypsy subclass n=2 Tax=Oryza sativa subsp. japonica TaxID=39947 RepID=Q53KP4_ORYSJ|nr:retrotransposon protein, putative, Ty3-gypsy sub-class [Oryza sativa Japonica Group]ABA92459.1 retrotransposon protein, putative, Ty3-gypsy subclass [Oryza sativa Japonica Group]
MDRVHGGGSRERTAEIDPSKTDGRDPSVHDRLTADDPDDVSGDVITGGGSGGASSHARRRTTARRRERRTPTDSGRHGELTGDQRNGAGATDGDGVKVKAAEKIGSTAATVLRRSTAMAKGRTRTAATWRPRWRPSRATATTGATAAHGWSGGDDGGTKSHGARALPTARGESKGGGG